METPDRGPLVSLIGNAALSLVCGALGGGVVLGFSETTPAPHAPVAPTDAADCKTMARQLDALTQLVEAMRTDRPVPPSPPAPEGLPQPNKEQTQERFDSQIKSMNERFAAKRAERNIGQAQKELAEQRTMEKNSTDEDLAERVHLRLTTLRIPENESATVDKLAVPYLRKRRAAIVGMLERSAEGTAPAPETVDTELSALSKELEGQLPSTLDADARKAVMDRIDGMVRAPYFLRN